MRNVVLSQALVFGIKPSFRDMPFRQHGRELRQVIVDACSRLPQSFRK